MWPPGWQLARWSPGLYALFDLDPTQPAPTREEFLAMIPAELRAQEDERYAAILARQDPGELLYSITTARGVARQLRIRSSLHRDAVGRPLPITGM